MGMRESNSQRDITPPEGKDRMVNRWGFTVFVDNLPFNLDRHGLKGIFQRVGNVND